MKNQEEKIKRENLKDQKREEIKNKILDERKKEKEFIQNYFKEKENKIKKQNLIIKEKYKEENKMLKSVNEEILKKNKKQYDTLKNEKEKLEEKKKEKSKEFLEEKKIRVNAIKKFEDKEKNEKEATIDKNSAKTLKGKPETMDTLLSIKEKNNYKNEKNLIEQYKKFCEDLLKQEKQYMEKIEQAKKISKNRSGSAGRIRVFVPKKNKNMKNRTKSSYKFSSTGKNISSENTIKKVKEHQKPNINNNIKKINANEI